MVQRWDARFTQYLTKKLGSRKANLLTKKYQHAFPLSYFEQNSPVDILNDILQLEQLSPTQPFSTLLCEKTTQDDFPLQLKLFQYYKPIPLSDVLPMLENMDLRTNDERSYKITLANKHSVWLSNFNVQYVKAHKLALTQINSLFQAAFTHILFGQCENDGFNKLVLGAELNWRDISIMRAYAKYLHQVGFRFSQAYLENTLAKYSAITKKLIALFYARFAQKRKSITALETDLSQALENVTNLDEDRILRRFWQLIKATLRTNYFHTPPKEYLSFKFKSAEVPDLPLPHPLYEIFVYSPRFEGIHLRSEKVARGGIRWSDRREDFRTEILGLMKAQKVKNAVIVPSGAKGGFVLKTLPPDTSPAILQQEVIFCYQAFIRGLLDLTDNLKNNKPMPPRQVVCYDDPDPYLVVAADKGTASFSDLANKIAVEYDFWLGDAFASGGSIGYDHKKMAITARGAWESIKRHFREINLDFTKNFFTVVGIGDMSGDVFGNSMLYSKNIKLLAAFDHRHIFLDPNPNPAKSFAERQRLFNLAGSSWADYRSKFISQGGGVYSRNSKSITLTPEVKKMLMLEDNALPPNALICSILKAPVDLLFNGGIGTYVKASYESHASVGDKANEFLRVNGNELRCKVVGEGGNLGLTQLGRIEYALHGGIINTDFIDNSAGVDCSDHEVNIKILLHEQIRAGKLTEKKRKQLLYQMTDEVAELVLQDNYNQALAISFALLNSMQYTGLYQTYIKELERVVHLDRNVEFLPDDKNLLERKATGQGLTRPEFAVLLAYTKIHIKNEILKSDLTEDPYFNSILAAAFPSLLVKLYKKSLVQHSLRREIIATQISNQIINAMGFTFVYRLQTETGASIANIVRAYTVVTKIYDTVRLQKLLDAFSFKLIETTQYELLHYIRQLINLAARWFLRGARLEGAVEKTITHYKKSIQRLEDVIPHLIVGLTKKYMDTIINQFVAAGLQKDVAKKIAMIRSMYTALNVTEIATQFRFDLVKTAQVYFAVGSKFNLVWFRDQIGNDTREGHWNTMARLTLRDELDTLQRNLTIAILKSDKQKAHPRKLISHWLSKNQTLFSHWEKLLEMLHGSTNVDYTIFFTALRELANLIPAA